MATPILLRRANPCVSRLVRSATLASFTTSHSLSTLSSYLVTPAELNEALKRNSPSKLSTAPKTIPLCGSWFLPNDPGKRKGWEVYKQRHIPSARFFDIDRISDTSSPYPHMLPSPEVFKEAMSELGINRDDTVVVYDTAELGIFSAPRVAWTLNTFGHPAVHVLNNFRLWVEQGLPTEEGEQQHFRATKYPTPELDASNLVAFDEMRELARDYNEQGREEVHILDARSEGRWKGTEPEPRPGLPSGHIPGSTSVPITDLLDPQTKAFLPPDELRRVFEKKGIDPHKPVISSCGTGVTATIIDTALTAASYTNGRRRVYDGSWTEWAQRVRPTENLIVKSQE